MISTGRYLFKLMRSLREESDLHDQRKRQRFQRFVAEAVAASPFHRKRMKTLGLRPQDLREPADLQLLPVMERLDLQQRTDAIATPAAREQTVQVLRTSGSSGVPLETRITADESRVRQALNLRARILAGRKPWYREAVIGSFAQPSQAGRSRFFRWSMHLSAMEDSDTLLSALQRFAPDYVVAFPSTLLRFGEYPGLDLQLITTGSEVLEQSVRRTLERRFAVPVRDTYGAVETGLLAFQCTVGEGYHLNDDVSCFEFRPVVGPKNDCEILVTPLYARAVPLVRYRLGDVVRPLSGSCACGCPLPRIAAVEGRRDDWLLRPDGTEIPPAAIRLLFRGALRPLAYRVTQSLDNRICLECVSEPGQEGDMLPLSRSLATLVGQPVETRIVYRIDPEPSGKLRAIRRLGAPQVP